MLLVMNYIENENTWFRESDGTEIIIMSGPINFLTAKQTFQFRHCYSPGFEQ